MIMQYWLTQLLCIVLYKNITEYITLRSFLVHQSFTKSILACNLRQSSMESTCWNSLSLSKAIYFNFRYNIINKNYKKKRSQNRALSLIKGSWFISKALYKLWVPMFMRYDLTRLSSFELNSTIDQVYNHKYIRACS